MLPVSRNSRTRSSLEEMLEALQRRDDDEKPKDLPPELPSRPRLTAKTRPPSFKRRLPTSFETANGGLESSEDCNFDSQKEEVKELIGNSFGAKKVKDMESCIMSTQRKESKRRWDGSIDYFTKNKLSVWCHLQNGQWESGHIQSTSQEKAYVKLSDGSEVVVSTTELLPANPDILEGVDDLVQLSYPNEPSVLHNLQHRYSHERIYSKAGRVLIAVNPFKDVNLYGNEFITAYRQKLVDDPHVYSIADAAYTEMMEVGVNQSIIMSGESGSGKTETAKVAMEYLAALGGSSNGIECKLLETSCILEAFGNAKTSRNNNSSRFGKLIEIHFSETGKICGAKIHTLLLEESRVIQLAQGERSYHIFYQLCAGAPAALRDKLKLKGASEYNYLNQTECLIINDVDDAEKFHMLVEALNTVNICKKDQEHAFEMLAAVLWLGNISFEVIDNEGHVEAVADEAVTNAASLIGCSAHDLTLALSTCRVQLGKDKVTKRLTMQQAIDTRNALAKFIYGSLFNWLVDEINKSLAMEKQHTCRSINILDIYGFEAFENNSFEQFCINYGNERLQQHFNRHLFKLEQEEYELDGIDRIKVEFEDNQECLDLFEKKPTGLISLLDEESNSPEATDLTFASKLKQHLTANRCFKGERGGTFSIQHCAGEVLYSTCGFLEKNRDMLHADIVQLLSSSSSELPRLFTSLLNQSQKQSVATKFKGQLFNLMQQLEKTTPHFICCIKPNNKQLPGMFEKNLVLKQLRCCGVLDAVKMSRCGYPTRITHLDFTRRYGLLMDNTVLQDPLSTSVAILQQFNILPEMYQVGYTKLYFRAGQINVLEDARKQILQGALEVQKCTHRPRACHYFHDLNGGVTKLQSFVRGEIARRQFNTVVKSKEQLASKKIDEQLVAVVRIQSAIRGRLARKHVSSLRNLKKLILDKCKEGRKILEVKDLPSEVLPFVIEELQKHLFMSKATLGQKEKENTALKEKVEKLEEHWSEYEAKMRTMEETWQKQIASLQASLAAAKKSLAADNAVGLPPRCFYDSEGAVGSSQEIDGGFSTIGRLVKEFEHRKQNFDEKATAILQVSTGQLLSANPEDELRRLRLQFEQWKKEYKVRLRVAKIKVHKLGHSESERSRRTWWGGKTSRRFQI